MIFDPRTPDTSQDWLLSQSLQNNTLYSLINSCGCKTENNRSLTGILSAPPKLMGSVWSSTVSTAVEVLALKISSLLDEFLSRGSSSTLS